MAHTTYSLNEPPVTCIMPTYNRRPLVSRALEYFLRQDYANRELVIVDTGTDPVRDLVPETVSIRYLRVEPRPTIGAVRNLACEAADGEVILHWDDDDWHARHRIRYQVEALLQTNAEVVGLNRVFFYDLRDRSAWLYAYLQSQRLWLRGNSLCYRRTFWADRRFPDIDIGEDTRFIENAHADRMSALPDSTFHVSVIHGGNVSAPRPSGRYWRRTDAHVVRRMLGADLQFYDHLQPR
jgi:glycosyltransferase involved in cell wall biosynthesis